MKGPIGIVLLAALAGGCTYGMTAQKFRPAHDPHGIEATVTTSNGPFAGELIEIRETGLVLHTEIRASAGTGASQHRLRLVPYGAIRSARFEQLGSGPSISDGRTPSDKTRERLRLLSRFPQGLSPELLSQLLKEYGQTELAGIER